MSTELIVARLNTRCKQILRGKADIQEAYDIVKELEGMEMTNDALQNTFIAITLNQVRKMSSENDLIKRVRALIRSWQRSYDDGSMPLHSKRTPKRKMKKRRVSITSESSHVLSNNQDSELEVDVKRVSDEEVDDIIVIEDDEDNEDVLLPQEKEMRLKAREMLKNALDVGELPENEMKNVLELCSNIEKRIHSVCGGVNDSYRSSMRSRVFNLRDKKNPQLKENVRSGLITPQRFAEMNVKDMASAEMKKLREIWEREAILEHQIHAEDQGVSSDLFHCEECRSDKCTYSQMQILCADEPMTTFIYCRECGHRWTIS